jgi:hypothetical protein
MALKKKKRMGKGDKRDLCKVGPCVRFMLEGQDR